MEHITIGQIGLVIGTLVSLLGGIDFLFKKFQKGIQLAVNKELQELKGNIKELNDNINANELQACTNFIVQIIETAKREKVLDETVKQRFYEELDIYYNKYHKNSYVHKEVDELQKKGIL